MARELGDVLHYFIDQPEARPVAPPVSVVAVPVGEQDVVRSAYVWNLAVEIARTGGLAAVVASGDRDGGVPWPDPGPGPLGAEFVPSFARDLRSLTQTVREVAHAREHQRKDGLILVQVPPEWLDAASDTDSLLSRTLLLTTPEPQELRRAYGVAERLLALAPDPCLGVTIHGVRDIDQAREAFLQLASATERQLGQPLLSYGLLLDDLDVYRAIVERRAVGIARPQSRAARALRDVARLLMEDLCAPDA